MENSNQSLKVSIRKETGNRTKVEIEKKKSAMARRIDTNQLNNTRKEEIISWPFYQSKWERQEINQEKFKTEENNKTYKGKIKQSKILLLFISAAFSPNKLEKFRFLIIFFDTRFDNTV